MTHNCVAVFTPSGMTDVPVRPRCDDRVCNEMTVGVTGNAMRLSHVRPDPIHVLRVWTVEHRSDTRVNFNRT